jgi:hypothetical protein
VRENSNRHNATHQLDLDDKTAIASGAAHQTWRPRGVFETHAIAILEAVHGLAGLWRIEATLDVANGVDVGIARRRRLTRINFALP